MTSDQISALHSQLGAAHKQMFDEIVEADDRVMQTLHDQIGELKALDEVNAKRLDNLFDAFAQVVGRIATLESPPVTGSGATVIVDATDNTNHNSGTTTDAPAVTDDQPDPPVPVGEKTRVSAFTPKSGETYSNMLIHGGVRVIDEDIHDVIYRDCDFRDADFLLHVRGNDTITPSGWQFIDCTFEGATPEPDFFHSSGVLLYGVTNFQFIRCIFDRNGWTASGKRSNRNHNIYLSNVGNIHIVDCKIFNAAAQGIKARGVRSLSVRGCEFAGNLIDIKTDSRDSGGPIWIDKCVFHSEGGIDSNNSEYCWSLHFEHHAGESKLELVNINNCLWDAQPTMKNAVLLTLIGSGIGAANMENCDISGWQPTIATRGMILDTDHILVKTDVTE